MALPAIDMQTWTARLASFQGPQRLSKRRPSAQSRQKKRDDTVEWPHTKPDPEELARAGFFYRPSQDSADNVQCFLCTVKLDGWEETDDPVREHVAHSSDCAWATTISVSRDDNATNEPPEVRDPMSDAMTDARRATFTTGQGWPHESKKGWKCRIAKMVDAGWCWDPTAETEDFDGVTCFYCSLSLDGWEPKDDPFVEHQRRSPDCRFFTLLEQFYGTSEPSKVKKSKGRTKASNRGSTASKASRISTQSMISEVTDIGGSVAETLGDAMSGDATLGVADDSIVTTASQATNTGGNKSRGKGGRVKAAAKGTKARKKIIAEFDQEERAATHYSDIIASRMEPHIVPTPSPKNFEDDRLAIARSDGARVSTQSNSSVVEISQIHAAPPKKTARPRKTKAQTQSHHEAAGTSTLRTPDAAAIYRKRESEVSAQLQEELEFSMDTALEEAQDESTPQVHPSKRGIKRTSDGLRKPSEPGLDVVEVDFPVPPKQPRATNAKAKAKAKGSKSAKGASDDSNVQPDIEEPILDSAGNDLLQTGSETSSSIPAPKKGKGRSKGNKSSSNGISRSSKATVGTLVRDDVEEELENLDQDEREIESELERLAREQARQEAMQSEQDQQEEYEPSPSHTRPSRTDEELQKLEREVRVESDPLRKASPARPAVNADLTPSPSGSDKENQPSSNLQRSAKHSHQAVIISPTKTTRIALAPGTPNRSPAKVLFTSPSKQISHLSSSVPWTAVDLETVLLPSPQPTPGRLGRQLVDAAGSLTSPESKMSVEEWIRFRAGQSEEDLRLRCEQMVGAFETEGLRALECLNGIRVVT